MPRDALLASTLADIARGLGLPAWASRVTLPVARPFVRDMLEMDAAIGRGGLAEAARFVLDRYCGPLTVVGAERVPRDGPVVIASNHPGVVDAPALWAALAGRDDLRTVALDREFLKSIPHLAARLLYVESSPHSRTRLVRLIADHLRQGGALLTFPAGTIEPDPARRLREAVAALPEWGRSPELFARLVPGTVVVPVAVSGVLAERFLRLPVVRWRRAIADRELMAATLQVMLRDRSVTPRVLVGEPLSGASGLTERLAAAMTRLLKPAAASRR